MKELLIILLVCIVGASLLAAASPRQVVAPGNTSSKSADAAIPAPKESRLAWENHRLRAANLRMALEAFMRKEHPQEVAAAEAEDRAADEELAAMQKAVGDGYAPHISKEGLLEFVPKEPVKTEAKTANATQPAKPKQ